MVFSYFDVGGIIIRLESEIPISCGDIFKTFLCDKKKCDIAVTVKVGNLPTPTGEIQEENQFYRRFVSPTKTLLYSRQKVGKDFVDYACRQVLGSHIELLLSSEKWLSDTKVFDALNVPELLLAYGCVLFHCSFVLYQGKAILFSGDKGVGKSTQASLWEKFRGAKVINSDRAVLKIVDGVLTAYGTFFCGSSHFALLENAPVSCIVFLEQSESNRLTRITNAFVPLFSQMSIAPFQIEQGVKLAEKFCNHTNFYSLKCTPTELAIKELEAVL